MSAHADFQALREHISRLVLGQLQLVDHLLLALLADGHLIVEGAPGLAKTRAVRVLSEAIEGDFHRIQFTPDLLPADLTGTDVYHPESGSFVFQAGPLFNNMLLADEINRAPAKVQSALLEAMAERQVTVGKATHSLPPLFLVMATQNPIEQEGTYPLPEAQLDRFLLYVRIDYPDAETEKRILHLARREEAGEAGATPVRISQETIFAARREVVQVFFSAELEEYLVQLVMATRDPGIYEERLATWSQYGASPRGTIALDRCARARAWLAGRDYVVPDDIHAVAHEVLRHRVLLTYEAEAEGANADEFIAELLARIAVP
ncbi:MAG: AAA family ATPase [Gammaproteobacteria bacterium]|nr:AAA family ATPase [Gammaproteobacteria bacterium]